MKRYAVKHGAFYLSRFPSVHGSPDPFDAQLYESQEQAAEDLPVFMKALPPDAGEVDIVQLTLAESKIGRAFLEVVPPRRPLTSGS